MCSFSVSEQATQLYYKIEELCQELKRPLPTIVAVTKYAQDEEVLELAKTGLVTNYAENRVDLFLKRKQLLDSQGKPFTYHLIGRLQTNKVKQVAGVADLIQSLDRLSLAEELEKRISHLGIHQQVLCEVNSGEEPQKGGLVPKDVLPFLKSLQAFPYLDVMGLMTMGPNTQDKEQLSMCFFKTQDLFQRAKEEGLIVGEGILSMGMSSSYKEALLAGATMIRIGRAFFTKEGEEHGII